MDYGEYLDDAFTYTKDGIVTNLFRWAGLVLAVLCLGIPMNGYVMRIYRGTVPAPDADRWGTLIIDGLKLMIVSLVWAIPIMIVWAFIYGSMVFGIPAGTSDAAAFGDTPPRLGLLLLLYAVEIVIGILMPVVSIRFARTDSFSEAFNIGAILGTIGKIGWIRYLIALIILAIVIGIPVFIIILGVILLGGAVVFMFTTSAVALIAISALLVVVMVILSPLFSVFQARYLTRVYDSAAPAE